MFCIVFHLGYIKKHRMSSSGFIHYFVFLLLWLAVYITRPNKPILNKLFRQVVLY